MFYNNIGRKETPIIHYLHEVTEMGEREQNSEFVKIIYTSGLELCGKLSVSVSALNDRVEIQLPLVQSTSSRHLRYQKRSININQIASLHRLDNSYFPKLISNWVNRDVMQDEIWLVQLITKDTRTRKGEKIIGALRAASAEYQIGTDVHPISFDIQEDPLLHEQDRSFSIADVASMSLIYNNSQVSPELVGPVDALSHYIGEKPTFIIWTYIEEMEKNIPSNWCDYLLNPKNRKEILKIDLQEKQINNISSFFRKLMKSRLIPTDRNGYSHFFKLTKKSKEEISGRLYSFSYSHIGIRTPIIDYTESDQSDKRWIASDEIDSITLLDRFYAPKLAHDWSHRNKGDLWLICIILGNEKVIGLLRGINEQYQEDCQRPITFQIQVYPNVGFYTHYQINDFNEISLLYSSESYEQEKEVAHKTIRAILNLHLPTVLTSLLCEYFHGLPENIPTEWCDYLKNLENNKKKK